MEEGVRGRVRGTNPRNPFGIYFDFTTKRSINRTRNTNTPVRYSSFRSPDVTHIYWYITRVSTIMMKQLLHSTYSAFLIVTQIQTLWSVTRLMQTLKMLYDSNTLLYYSYKHLWFIHVLYDLNKHFSVELLIQTLKCFLKHSVCIHTNTWVLRVKTQTLQCFKTHTNTSVLYCCITHANTRVL